MSLNLPSSPASESMALPPPRTRHPIHNLLVVTVVVVAVVAGVVATRGSALPSKMPWQTPPEPIATVPIDRGDLVAMVTETGSVESANNVTVRCQVEALIGLVGGGKAGQNSSGSRSGTGGSGTGGTTQGTGSASTAITDAAKSKSTPPKASTSKTSKSGSAASAAKSSAIKSAGSADSTASSSSGSGSGSASGSSGTSTAVTTLTRPQISSFTMKVTPYTPLRPATKSSTISGASKKKSSGGMGGGGGGGGGGETEKPGSTRILTIKPEGTPVAKGDIVCELDSSAFRDEVLAQQIKYDQAKAYVDQAKALLSVNELSRIEYRDGILPQDRLLIRQYLESCETDEKRLARNVQWSSGILAKGYRSPAQHSADVLNYERAKIALEEARGMQDRLENYTAPKILKTLDAKLEANRADILAQEGAFQLESDRLNRLKRMVAFCTLRAPGDGIVVYAQPASGGWRTSTTSIQEGVTVREGQAIFELPDVRHMRVKTRVNESKIRDIQIGQRARIQIDAFPDRTLLGSVSEITAIPAPANPFSDVRVYFVNVTLDSGNFEGLRGGLTAEVSFDMGRRESVTRIPLTSIRWRDGQPYAAITTNSERTAWEWRPIELGMMTDLYGEVRKGLDVGDQVVAQPYELKTAPPIPTAPTTLQARDEVPTRPRG